MLAWLYPRPSTSVWPPPTRTTLFRSSPMLSDPLTVPLASVMSKAARLSAGLW